MLPVVGTCVSLSWQIVQLLMTSKANKSEHKSLHSALTNICSFLEGIAADVTPQGNEVLSKCSSSWPVGDCAVNTCVAARSGWSISQVLHNFEHKQLITQVPHPHCSTLNTK